VKSRSPARIIYWIALLLLFPIQSVWQEAHHLQTVAYSDFEKALGDGRITKILISDQTIVSELKMPDGNKTALAAVRIDPALASRLEMYGVPFARVVEGTFWKDMLSWLAPTAIFLAIWYLLFRNFAEKQNFGSFLSIGKSHAKVYAQSDTGITFADVRALLKRRLNSKKLWIS
jgi:cell division protease FtsH